jgi:hypothetical protein
LVREESFEFMGCVIEIWKFGIDERIRRGEDGGKLMGQVHFYV